MEFQRSKNVGQRLEGRSKIVPKRWDVIYGWSLKLPIFYNESHVKPEGRGTKIAHKINYILFSSMKF